MRGTFDSDAERLIMREAITVATSTGVTGKLTRATLDTKKQTLRSHAPVAFRHGQRHRRANALTLHSSEHTLLFRGDVHVHINKTAKPAAAADAGRDPSRNRCRRQAAATGGRRAAATLGDGEMPR